MKPHDWSRRVCVYETIDGVTCRNCGAQIYAMDDDGDLDKDCEKALLPLDCDAAIPFVIHEDYKDWDAGAWDDKDDVPEWGKWGVALNRELGKHFPWPCGSQANITPTKCGCCPSKNLTCIWKLGAIVEN